MIDYEDLILQRQELQEIYEDDPEYFEPQVDEAISIIDDMQRGHH